MNRCQTCAIIGFLILSVGSACGAAGAGGPGAAVVDFNGDRIVNLQDFARLAQSWQQSDTAVDVAPSGGDGIVNYQDLAALAGYWLQEIPQPIYITWIGHASVKIAWEDTVVYVDPRKITGTPRDATVVLVTHSHSDHYSPADIAKVVKPGTRFLGPADVVKSYGSGQILLPGQTIDVDGLPVTGVAAYNLTTSNHPKANNWLGFVVQLGGKRIYCAGDTDLTPEMKALTNIDVAFLPAGGTYTFDAAGAAEATKYLQPLLAIPYHWGEIVGTLADAQRFAKAGRLQCEGHERRRECSAPTTGRKTSPSSPIGSWMRPRAPSRTTAPGPKTPQLVGGALWQPAGGKVAGAIQLDGVDDYIKAPFVLNPSSGSLQRVRLDQRRRPGPGDPLSDRRRQLAHGG